MRLLFVRHGQIASRASAATDPADIDRHFAQEQHGDLTPRGEREAEAVAARLRGQVDALYASPLPRARQTAEIAGAALGMDVTVHDGLAELRTGRLRPGTFAHRWVAGWSRASLPFRAQRAILGASLIPLYHHAWRRGDTVGGEAPEALAARVAGLLWDLEAAHAPDASVALFTHGYLMVTLTWGLGRRARLALLRRLYIPNGAITEMRLTHGALELVRHADARHLPPR